MSTEIKRLRQVLEDIANAQMMFNGGVAPPSRRALFDFIDQLQSTAAEALRPRVRCQECADTMAQFVAENVIGTRHCESCGHTVITWKR